MKAKLIVTLTATLLTSVGAYAKEKDAAAPAQTITPASQQKTIQGAANIFTGPVTVNFLANATEGMNTTTAYVNFKPSARSFWHTHPQGQYLVITKGDGLVQEWGKPAVKVHVGDVIYCPPGIKHWHGATAHSEMTHLAMTGTEKNGHNVDWLEQVSDQQYQEANR